MENERPSCSICAYRETCNKKYSITDPSKCLDYTRDLRLNKPGGDGDAGE